MVIKAMFSERGKLPIELREKMLDFYERKTKLKGVDGKEYEYLKSKNRLNVSPAGILSFLINALFVVLP